MRELALLHNSGRVLMGRQVSYKARIALIEVTKLIRANRDWLDHQDTKATELIKKDYWTIKEVEFIEALTQLSKKLNKLK